MENQELEQIKRLPASKTEIALFAERISDALDSGDVDPLLILRQFKSIEKIFETIKPKLTKLAVTAADKFPEKVIETLGCKFEKSEAGVSYDFTNCNDGVRSILLTYQDEYKNKIKEREDLLKALREPMEIVDEDSGEITKLFPPTKKSTTVVKVTFV